jgi:hypothetical protein
MKPTNYWGIYTRNRLTVLRERSLMNLDLSERDIAKYNLENREYNGFISRNTKSKLTRKINAWYEASTYYNPVLKKIQYRKNVWFSFVTLTLSSHQKHTDNDIKRNMLNRFIQELDRRKNVKNWFWVAEKQKNGNIHFHVIIDRFVDKDWIRDTWNMIQYDNEYINEIASVNNRKKYPSTEIKSMKSNKGVIGYCLKYMTKDDGSVPVTGRLWGMSDRVRNIDAPRIKDTTDFEDMLDRISIDNDFDIIEYDYCTVLQGNICEAIYTNDSVMYSLIQRHEEDNYLYLNGITDRPSCFSSIEANIPQYHFDEKKSERHEYVQLNIPYT